MSTYIAHFGTKGQRWYHRRYQNKDGSLTPLGRARLGYGDKKLKLDSKGKPTNDPVEVSSRVEGEVAKDLRNVSNIGTNVKNITQSLANKNKKDMDRQRQQVMDAMDLSEWSDKELQAAINRMNLEKNYKNLSTERVASGKRYATNRLESIGEAVAVTASIVSIFATIHELRK